MPESAYSRVGLEPPSEHGGHQQRRRNRLDRSRSTTKDAMVKADQYIRDSYVLVQPTLIKTKEVVRELRYSEVSKVVLLHLVALSCLVVTITAITYIGQIPVYVRISGSDQASRICQPDGSFNPGLDYSSYNNWSPSGFFQITLGFGQLSFSTVKIIDVIWDVVVGRGGQAALAGTSYMIFSKSLLRIMERESVSYGTFEVLGFQTASAATIFKLTRDYLTNHGVRAKLVMLWIIISSIFVVAFPTLVSAMTGYNSNSHAFVLDRSKSLTPWTNFKTVQYIVNDGWRVGLSGRFLLTDLDLQNDNYDFSNSCESFSPYQTYETLDNGSYSPFGDYNTVPPRCRLLWHVSEYVSKYGFDSYNHTIRSTFNNSGQIYKLPAPPLNVTAHYLSTSTLFGGSRYTNYEYTLYNGQNSYDSSQSLYAFDNETYDVPYILENGTCQPTLPLTYRWGFSFLLLFITMLLTAIWTLGMYIMWLDAYLYSRFDRAHRDMGTHRAALDFAAAMRKDIGEDATEDLSNSELKKRVRRGLNGWRVSYEMMDGEKVPLSRVQELRIYWDRHGWRQWSKRTRILVVGGGLMSLFVIILISALLHPA